MTAHEPNDDTADKGRATTRRQFLGAAAAATGLAGFTGSSTATRKRPNIDITEDEWGATRASLPRRSGLSAHLEVDNIGDDDVAYHAKAYRYDDEENHVSLTVSMGEANLNSTLSVEEARTIAADLKAAADHAEGQHGDD